MKRTLMTAAISAAVVASGIALAVPAAHASNVTPATVATPSGSFHIPVVPYPFSGSFGTTFSLYALPFIPAGTVGYEVVLTDKGDEQLYNPPTGSTIILSSDTDGLLEVPVASGTTTLSPDPIPTVDFANSGLNGFITGAGDYSLAIKFFGATGLTGAEWTSVYFNGAATSTNAPSWQWDPSNSNGAITRVATTAGTSVSTAVK